MALTSALSSSTLAPPISSSLTRLMMEKSKVLSAVLVGPHGCEERGWSVERGWKAHVTLERKAQEEARR